MKKLRACEEGWGEVGSSDANKKRSPYPFRAYPPINPHHLLSTSLIDRQFTLPTKMLRKARYGGIRKPRKERLKYLPPVEAHTNEIGHLKPLNVFGYESSDDAFCTNSSDYQYHTQEPYVPIYPLSA